MVEMARTKNKKKDKPGEIAPQAQASQDKGGLSILQKMMRQVKAKTGFTKTMINPEGELSISDAISNIIAPYRDTASDYQSFKAMGNARAEVKAVAGMVAPSNDEDGVAWFVERILRL